MAKNTIVPLEWLLFKGQQCKVFSLIAQEARLQKYTIPIYTKTHDISFKGATVLTAKKGIYFSPVAGLDFASLYPSIIIAYNLCYTTYIETEEMLEIVKAKGIPYKTIEWEEDDEITHEKKYFKYSFVQYDDENGVVLEKGFRGILPMILLKQWEGRKETKKLMKTETDKFKWAVLNGKQLAEKVTMNSAYGFTGANNGILPLKPIAASTTSLGRSTIKKTAYLAESQFGVFVVYGDSIPPDELVTVKTIKSKHVDIEIEKLANDMRIPWQEYRGFKVGDVEIRNKEYKNLENSGILTYTHEGFQPINKIIRHSTNKKIYKITAVDSTGKLHSVRVTEGHSLIGKNGELLKAQDAKIGDALYDYTSLV